MQLWLVAPLLLGLHHCGSTWQRKLLTDGLGGKQKERKRVVSHNSLQLTTPHLLEFCHLSTAPSRTEPLGDVPDPMIVRFKGVKREEGWAVGKKTGSERLHSQLCQSAFCYCNKTPD